MTLFRLLCDVLSNDGWDYEYDQKNEIVRLEIDGVTTTFYSFIYVDEEQESLLCNTHVSIQIPYTKRLAVCEFMNRVNYEMANGNFEMDMENGEVRYRTSLDLADTIASKEQILNLIWNGAQTFDNYYPGLLKLLSGDYTSEEAVDFCNEEDND